MILQDLTPKILRFQPHGMSRTLFATALAQALVAVIALIAWMHQSTGSSVVGILFVNGFFAALFVWSAWLFRNAAREQSIAGAGPENDHLFLAPKNSNL